MSAPRFTGQIDTDDGCSAYYKSHEINCTAHWRRPNQWHVFVRDKAGETVAETTYHGSDRRAMLTAGARAAGLLENVKDEPRGGL